MTEATEMTAREFTERVGVAPEQDNLERVNCRHIGEAGHSSCGWCAIHDTPRFVCGCRVEQFTVQR